LLPAYLFAKLKSSAEEPEGGSQECGQDRAVPTAEWLTTIVITARRGKSCAGHRRSQADGVEHLFLADLWRWRNAKPSTLPP
jgi:hypothetical protein